jgi:hypothetical protein
MRNASAISAIVMSASRRPVNLWRNSLRRVPVFTILDTALERCQFG